MLEQEGQWDCTVSSIDIWILYALYAVSRETRASLAQGHIHALVQGEVPTSPMAPRICTCEITPLDKACYCLEHSSGISHELSSLSSTDMQIEI